LRVAAQAVVLLLKKLLEEVVAVVVCLRGIQVLHLELHTQ
jgi:hypothetical protein